MRCYDTVYLLGWKLYKSYLSTILDTITWRVSNCEELVGVTHRGRWIWFYKVSFFKRIGKAGTKIKGIEENDNGQGNRSMVN